jgi:hypothetical protein
MAASGPAAHRLIPPPTTSSPPAPLPPSWRLPRSGRTASLLQENGATRAPPPRQHVTSARHKCFGSLASAQSLSYTGQTGVARTPLWHVRCLLGPLTLLTPCPSPRRCTSLVCQLFGVSDDARRWYTLKSTPSSDPPHRLFFIGREQSRLSAPAPRLGANS